MAAAVLRHAPCLSLARAAVYPAPIRCADESCPFFRPSRAAGSLLSLLYILVLRLADDAASSV